MLSGVFNAFSSGSIKARLRAVRAIAVAIPRVRAWATDFFRRAVESIAFFFFRLDTKEKEPKRKNQGCVFSATPVISPAKGQKLATLKQSALLNAEENTCA